MLEVCWRLVAQVVPVVWGWVVALCTVAQKNLVVVLAICLISMVLLLEAHWRAVAWLVEVGVLAGLEALVAKCAPMLALPFSSASQISYCPFDQYF